MQDRRIDDWRVLVVEDDVAVAAVHCRFTAMQPGFRVVGRAGTAPEAQQLIASTQPDLVLLDLELPGPSGLALLRNLRGEKKTTEVIVITAHARPDVVRSSMQLGAVDYLVKPFWPERLAEALALFTQRMERLRQPGALDQQAIDRLRGNGDVGAGRAGATNIRSERLGDVRKALVSGVPMTAEEVAAETGMARVTARRYLEHLVSLGQCTVDAVSLRPGRPAKTYQLWDEGPIGGASTSN